MGPSKNKMRSIYTGTVAPFGHAGEQMLHEIMVPNASVVKGSPFYKKDVSEITERFARENNGNTEYLEHAFGFKHNLQSVRVAALLEDSYRGENSQNIGLNLTNYTLYGMMAHSAPKYNEEDDYPNFQSLFSDYMKVKGCDTPAWSFEAYIVKWADDVAQWHHDLEDAMREGVLPIKRICNTISASLAKALNPADKEKLKNIQKQALKDRRCIAELSHIVVNTLVNDIVETSKKNLLRLKSKLRKKNIHNAERLFKEYDTLGLPIAREKVITVSKKINPDEFRGIIKGSVHHSRSVERMNEKGKYIIRKLFEAYFAHPQQLPDGWILHLLVESDSDKYTSLDEAKSIGIGEARVDFEKMMKNPNIHLECMLMRRICDHIACMTDHYAIEEYNNLYG